MAISTDTSASTFNGSTTSLTLSYTMGSGSNGLLIVACLHNSGDHITGVTYNGVPMTFDRKANLRGSLWGYIYFMYSPPSGAHNIVVSSDGTTGEIDIQAASYFGVAQSGFPDAAATDTTSTGTSLAISVTTVSDNSWAFLFFTPNNATVTAGTNATLLQNNIPAADSACFDSSGHGAITPAGSFSMTANASSATQVRGIMVSFAPLVVAATKSLAVLGVG